MDQERNDDDGPVAGRDILPFRSAKVLYALYHTYEIRYRDWLQSRKKKPGLIHHRIMTFKEFGSWVVRAKAEEMHERLHQWSMSAEKYFEWKMKEAM